jgi:hypothetical protein
MLFIHSITITYVMDLSSYPQASLNSQDLFKETILPEQILIWSGIYNTCIWIRSPIPIKHYLLITRSKINDKLQIKNVPFVPVQWFLAELWPLGLWNLAKYLVVTTFFTMIWYIDLIFGIWVYSYELVTLYVSAT